MQKLLILRFFHLNNIITVAHHRALDLNKLEEWKINMNPLDQQLNNCESILVRRLQQNEIIWLSALFYLQFLISLKTFFFRLFFVTNCSSNQKRAKSNGNILDNALSVVEQQRYEKAAYIECLYSQKWRIPLRFFRKENEYVVCYFFKGFSFSSESTRSSKPYVKFVVNDSTVCRRVSVCCSRIWLALFTLCC